MKFKNIWLVKLNDLKTTLNEVDLLEFRQLNWQPTPEETAEYERKMKEQREKYYG